MKKERVKEFPADLCPIAKSVDLIGDRWILLLIRACFVGYRRFDDFQDALQISRSVLSAKLAKMVAHKLLEKQSYQTAQQRPRYEYVLTPKGYGLAHILVGLVQWGNEHLVDPADATIVVTERTTGQPIRLGLLNKEDKSLHIGDIRLRVRSTQ
ncbi:MAG: helix-turn-helix domain-containing protein [Bacteroidota bacterium]